MPRRVALRALTRAERAVLREKVRDLSLGARVHQRYRIIDALRRGYRPLEVADRVDAHLTVVYDWIRRFNASGFAAVERVPNPKGRPAILKAEQLRAWVEVALSSPADRGLPFTTWSVPKLTEYGQAEGLLPPVTDEWVRRLLRREGLTPQRIRTGKTSHDPAVDRKKTSSGRSIEPVRRGRRWSASTSGDRSS